MRDRSRETYRDLASKAANCATILTLGSPGQGRREMKILDEEWIKTLEDGRKVKFVYQELPEDGAFITAQLAGHEVVYSVVLAKAGNPLSREDVENRFKGELSKAVHGLMNRHNLILYG